MKSRDVFDGVGLGVSTTGTELLEAADPTKAKREWLALDDDDDSGRRTAFEESEEELLVLYCATGRDRDAIGGLWGMSVAVLTSSEGIILSAGDYRKLQSFQRATGGEGWRSCRERCGSTACSGCPTFNNNLSASQRLAQAQAAASTGSGTTTQDVSSGVNASGVVGIAPPPTFQTALMGLGIVPGIMSSALIIIHI